MAFAEGIAVGKAAPERVRDNPELSDQESIRTEAAHVRTRWVECQGRGEVATVDLTGATAIELAVVSFALTANNRLGRLADSEVLSPRAVESLSEGLIRWLSDTTIWFGDCNITAERSAALFRRTFKPDITENSASLTFTWRSMPEEVLHSFPVLDQILSRLTAGFCQWAALLMSRVNWDYDRLRWLTALPATSRCSIEVVDMQRLPLAPAEAVATLAFRNGARVRYRPHDGGAEAFFAGLMKWVNERAGRELLLALRTLDRGEYCWSDYVTAKVPPTPESVGNLYQRVGMLCCLLGVFKGHCECPDDNLTVAGDQPTLLDFHLTWEPGISSDRGPDPTDVLPWLPAGVVIPWISEAPVIRDAKGCLYSWRDFRKEIERGFVVMYRLLLRHRDDMLASGGPLEEFSTRTCRVVLRDTSRFEAVRRRLFNPDVMRRILAWRSEIAAIARPIPDAIAYDDRMLRSERAQLSLLEFPRFWVRTTTNNLIDELGGQFRSVKNGTPYEEARDRLEGLCRADLMSRVLRLRHDLATEQTRMSQWRRNANSGDIEGEFKRLAEHEADLIAAELRATAVRGPMRQLTWLAPVGQERWGGEMCRVYDDLYNGTAGIALFFAARAAIGGSPRDREFVGRWVDGMAKRIGSPRRRAAIQAEIGLDGIGGCAGVVYVLSRISLLLDDEMSLSLAHDFARHLVAASVPDGGEPDVLRGAAGTIFALTALYELSGEAWLVQYLKGLSDRLLALRIVDRHTGARVWNVRPASHEKPVLATGFAHGSSGIAAALAAVFRHTRDPAIPVALNDVNAFLGRLYLSAEWNWYDVSPPVRSVKGNRVLIHAWCHGSVGICLGLLAMASTVDFDRSELELVLDRQWQREGRPLEDKLCCGEVGLAELLEIASCRLGRSEYHYKAEAVLRAIVSQVRARTEGRYVPYAPGLFIGRAGLGYQLLRVAFPDVLPSVLLFE